MRKNIGKIIVMMLMLVVLLPTQAFAEGNDEFLLNTTGTVTLVSSHAAREGISSLQFELLVDAKDADKIEFQFGENHAKVTEARYHEDTKVLTVYLAGTEALFEENTDTFVIGNVTVLDANGESVTATVRVVEDSLWYVYGTELKRAEGLTLPEAVVIGSGEIEEPEPPKPDDDGSQDGNGEDGSQDGSGNDGSTGTGGNGQNGNAVSGNGSTAASGNPVSVITEKSPKTTDGDMPAVIESGKLTSDLNDAQILPKLQETNDMSSTKVWAVLAVVVLILIFAVSAALLVWKQREYGKRR